jgi:hypothetical protein
MTNKKLDPNRQWEADVEDRMGKAQPSSNTKLYAERDIIGQGQAYCDHVMAMTAEGLHAKSDIAAELAHRDIEIERLQVIEKLYNEQCDAGYARGSALEPPAELPKPINHDLWRHLHDEHGLTLLQSELDEILRHANPTPAVHGPCPNCGAKWASVELSSSQPPSVDPLPIATAPRDGTSFIGVMGQWLTMVSWNKHRNAWCSVCNHYCPLPEGEVLTGWLPRPVLTKESEHG